MDEFSPENLALLNKRSLPIPTTLAPKDSKSRQLGPFLRGPVPMDWVAAAYKVGKGGGLLLGCYLWWIRGMSKGSKDFPVNISRLNTGQAISTKRRMLKILEQAGLLKRNHKPGKKLILELIQLPKGKESPNQSKNEGRCG